VKDADRWIADAAHRATALWMAEKKLRDAMKAGGEERVLKEAARLQGALR
jgi:hypothetical protein